jgi:hypothetical protein
LFKINKNLKISEANHATKAKEHTKQCKEEEEEKKKKIKITILPNISMKV